MRRPSIWESANRPMFVKSVWLETGHRHFILDYEPKRMLDSGTPTHNRREHLQASASCDFAQFDEGLLLVGSSKTQYEQNISQPKSIKPAAGNHRRFSSRKMILDHLRWRYDFLREDAQSKRSSLIDVNSVMTNNSQSDEKLAERVLNWLDLAGKTPLLRPVQQSRPETDRKKVKKGRAAQKLQESSTCSRGPDSVKHITIIFNKEGVPVRLNRPARNIDLCALSNSAVTVRRLAGNLASARLYEDGLSAEARTKDACDTSRTRPKTTSSRKTMTYEGFGKKKGSAERDNLTLRDPKRQLHIFMPSLPKKIPLSDEAISTDLTNQCKINSA